MYIFIPVSTTTLCSGFVSSIGHGCINCELEVSGEHGSSRRFHIPRVPHWFVIWIGSVSVDITNILGFKYIGNTALYLENTGKYEVLFGYEEAIGYMFGQTIRDKDGVAATVRYNTRFII